MKRFFKCPFCGHAYRVSENRRGKSLKCPACDGEYETVPAEAADEPPSKRPATDKARAGRRLFGIALGDPSVLLEGSIPGAIGGLLAGVLGPLLVGIFTGKDIGLVTAKVLLGFVGGFGVGTLGGMILVAIGRRIRPNFRIEPGILSVIAGAVIGAVVALIFEEIQWIPLGAGIGAVGVSLWPLLFRRLEAKLNPPNPTTFEEDPMREERQTSKRYSI
jgi:hypothetical protein